MCDICEKYPCREGCPNNVSAVKRRDRCFFCGDAFHAGDRYYRIGKQSYCEWCLLATDPESLSRICKIKTPELFEKIGFEITIGKDDLNDANN